MRSALNRTYRYVIYVSGCLLFLNAHHAGFAQGTNNELRRTLFADIDKLYTAVQSEQANLLSPSNFRKAMNKYKQAQDDFKSDKNLRDIENKLLEASGYFNICLDNAKLGKIYFATTLQAREEALTANAPKHARELYETAENDFVTAAKKLERGDIKGAKNLVFEIEAMFRQAELMAIKVSIIGNVRNLMAEAKDLNADKYTPITYANAQTLLNEAEAILNNNRRSESSAQERAEAAERQAKHAISLTKQIQWLKKNPNEWENFILDRETLIEELSGNLGFVADFDEGMDKPLKQSIKITRILQDEKKNLLREVEEKNSEIQRINLQLQTYREKEQGLQAELQEKQYHLEQKRKRDDLIASVNNLFGSNEAIVMRQNDDLMLRLIGLTFSSGKAVIQPEYFRLLTKVQRAIRKFPNAAMAIEGHTDSVGDNRYNENLSYERALAVKKYIIANMGFDDSRITAVGYGETRPIASNETREGRAQNRRIDVVITIGQEFL